MVVVTLVLLVVSAIVALLCLLRQMADGLRLAAMRPRVDVGDDADSIGHPRQCHSAALLAFSCLLLLLLLLHDLRQSRWVGS